MDGGEGVWECAKCGEAAVEVDVATGLAVCEACGAVADDSPLVQYPEWLGEGRGFGGVRVGADDTGAG